MNSTLKMITNSPLLPERNFKLESMTDIASGSDGASVISDFQYIKHSLLLSIKVNLDQINLDFVQSNNVNYITITNNTTNAKEIGYFVINKKWVAEKTIQFDLKMDTINSFLNDCVLSDKTKILRQHKDRYKITGVKSNGEFDNAVVESYDADVVFDGDDLGITINDTFPQATSVEKSLIIKISDLEDLAFFERTNESYTIIYNFEDANPLTISFTTYLLDNSYKITRQIDSLSNDADYSIDYNGKLKNNTITISSSEKYIAIRCVMTFTAPEEPTDLDYLYSIRYTGGAWEDITPEEIAECKTGFESGESSMLAFGTYVAPIDTLKFYPAIDRYSEMINPMLYGGVNLLFLENSKWLDQSWYLVYENQNSPTDSLTNPVDCYVFAGKGAKVASLPSFTGDFTLADIMTAIARINGYSTYQAMYDATDDIRTLTYLYIPAYWNQGARVQFSGASFESQTLDITFSTTGMIQFVPNEPTSTYPLIVNVQQADGSWINLLPEANTHFTFTNIKTSTIGAFTDNSAVAEWYAHYDLFGTSGTSQNLYPITSVDRTDPKLIKIIKLPYCPANITIGTGGLVEYDSDQWEYNNTKHALKLKNFNTKLSRILEFENNPFTPLLNYIHWEEVPFTSLRNDQYETKLYHSDFYQPKFVYDSFAFTFQLELITQTPVSKFRVQFNATNTINSKFLFTFLDYVCSNNEVADYNNILYVARNNECAIFNQQYVNYIRNGYQYDRKSLEIARNYGYEQLGLNAIIGGGNILYSAIGGLMGGKKSLGEIGFGALQQAYQLGASTLKGHLSIVQQVHEQELSMNARKNQLANQSTGVVDANDVDLLDAYTQNKAKFKVYKVSPRMKKALFDLFYYCGYTYSEQGIPDTTSRCRFNFVSADIIFKKVPNLSEDIIADIKARYNGGITFLHKISNAYDFDQKYENWENSMIQAIGG